MDVAVFIAKILFGLHVQSLTWLTGSSSPLQILEKFIEKKKKKNEIKWKSGKSITWHFYLG